MEDRNGRASQLIKADLRGTCQPEERDPQQGRTGTIRAQQIH